MRRVGLTLVLVVLLTVPVIAAGVASADNCVATDYKTGLTAALVNPGDLSDVEVDATGCDIGVYYSDPGPYTVSDSQVHGAKWFGIVNDGTTVNILDSQIYDIGDDPFSGAQHGVAIYFDATNGGSGIISGNAVFEYQKGGIVVNGEDSAAAVLGNAVTGLDAVPYIAQNGIQFGYGATGTVIGNTVDGNWYSGADWASTGILLFETDRVVVQGNHLVDNQTGIGIETWAWYRASASYNQVMFNTITGSEYGAYVASYAWDYTYDNPDASNNKIVNNRITSDAGLVGVGVFLYNVSTDFTATANNNKLIHNTMLGFDDAVVDEGSASRVHASVILP